MLGKGYERECAEARLLALIGSDGGSMSALGSRTMSKLAKDPEARDRVERATGRYVSLAGRRFDVSRFSVEDGGRFPLMAEAAVSIAADGIATVVSWPH